MSKYIQTISKIKPKNYGNSTFKIIDISDVEVDVNTDDFNVLCVEPNGVGIKSLTKSGINWKDSVCDIGGDLHIAGSLFEDSDQTLKNNILNINNALSIISQINGVQFTWKSNGKHDYGVIAQQVEKVIPQMVSYNTNTKHKQVSYIKLIPFLLEAIKQLDARVMELQNKKHNKKRFNILKPFSNILRRHKMK